MTIHIVPTHPEEAPGNECRVVIRTDQPHLLEVLSEDGWFCPNCQTLQAWDRVQVTGFNWCAECKQCYQCERIVTVTYRTRGTKKVTTELPR